MVEETPIKDSSGQQTEPAKAEAATTQSPQTPQKPTIPSTTEEKSLGAASYLPLLGFITVTLKPQSKYCTFHGNQGIAMTGLLFLTIFWLLVEQITGTLAFLGWFALSVAAAVKALGGEAWEIPILGALAKKINLGQAIKQAAGVIEQTTNEEVKKKEP